MFRLWFNDTPIKKNKNNPIYPLWIGLFYLSLLKQILKDMKVKDLIKQLQEIKNQDAEITLLGNVGNPDDEETDIYFDALELWEDGEESITLFVGLSHETLDKIREQEKEL